MTDEEKELRAEKVVALLTSLPDPREWILNKGIAEEARVSRYKSRLWDGEAMLRLAVDVARRFPHLLRDRYNNLDLYPAVEPNPDAGGQLNVRIYMQIEESFAEMAEVLDFVQSRGMKLEDMSDYATDKSRTWNFSANSNKYEYLAISAKAGPNSTCRVVYTGKVTTYPEAVLVCDGFEEMMRNELIAQGN